ncbi:glycosyltransferase family 4 protein [Aliiglaciecola litoralis]|uniref:Glycosyl transferase family 1 domain-containing protein n=1 Tax=Aliiglaciecola litoralis TaxID=582857 RepID=A0ABP3X7Y1_9ALTE
MQVDVIIEQRFYQCSQKKYWTDNAFPNVFWQRYLRVFSAVNVVARVSQVEQPQPEWQRVDGENLTFTNLPIYIGPWGFVKNIPNLIKALRTRKSAKRCVIYRVPGILALFYHWFAMPANKPYAAEVVGDPMDVFAKDASTSALRPVFKWIFVNMLTKQCQNAASISYVTEYSLQERYPPNPKAFHTHYSSIQLSDSDYKKRDQYPLSKPYRIVCIGNLSQPYKGCDFMLETLAALKSQGLELHLDWIGGGALQPDMEQLAAKLELRDCVNFVGNLSQRAQINEILDASDLFVLSSRQEGLPRVLIESMARSLNCVATNVGGVKELLPQEHIVERDNVTQLQAAIAQMMQLDESQRLQIGLRNFDKAQQYHNDVLTERRSNMYQALLESDA